MSRMRNPYRRRSMQPKGVQVMSNLFVIVIVVCYVLIPFVLFVF